MPEKLLLPIILLLLTFTSCDKKTGSYRVIIDGEVETILNKNYGTEPELNLVLKQEFRINGLAKKDMSQNFFSHPACIKTDHQGNIYILDNKQFSVKKFDKDGQFLTSFLEKGNGPGETTSAAFFNIHNDTIKVFDGTARKTIKFDLSGKYLETKLQPSSTRPMTLALIDENKELYLGHIWEEELVDNEFWIKISIALLDKNYNILKRFQSEAKKYVPKKFNLLDLMGTYTFSAGRIYIASPSAKEYQVFVYNLKGDFIRRIRKDYREIVMQKREVEEFNQNLKNVYKTELDAVKLSKRAINGLYVDQMDRLWIIPSLARTKKNRNKFYADIYSKEGIFLNRVFFLPQLIGRDYLDKENQLLINKNRLYQLNYDKAQLTSYSYE